jgi:hypothetical protein
MNDYDRGVIWGFFLGCVAAIMLLSLSGCITRQQIRAFAWENNGLPEDLCGPSKEESPHPHLWDYGFYRRLNNGKLQFVPYCKRDEEGKPFVSQYFSFHSDDVNRMLDGTLPEVPQ